MTVKFSDNLKDLFIDISTALISIPVTLMVNNLWNEKSRRWLNEDAFRYAKNEIE